jgi:pyridoxal phosphate enzyme (YggS family)
MREGGERSSREAPFPRLSAESSPPLSMLPHVSASRADIVANAAEIRERIFASAARADRDPGDVRIIGAAKTVDADRIRWAAEAGVTAIGQNYVQELAASREVLDDPALRWHYIGTLRSGSSSRVADLADVVETLAGERAARRLSGRAARSGRTLDVLIEVDFTGTRSGVAPDRVPATAELIVSLEAIRLRGLMTVPPLSAGPEGARPWFARLRALRDDLRRTHPDVLELSMGMSLDYEVAVEEGATMVRIGTALFGPRIS